MQRKIIPSMVPGDMITIPSAKFNGGIYMLHIKNAGNKKVIKVLLNN